MSEAYSNIFELSQFLHSMAEYISIKPSFLGRFETSLQTCTTVLKLVKIHHRELTELPFSRNDTRINIFYRQKPIGSAFTSTRRKPASCFQGTEVPVSRRAELYIMSISGKHSDSGLTSTVKKGQMVFISSRVCDLSCGGWRHISIWCHISIWWWSYRHCMVKMYCMD